MVAKPETGALADNFRVAVTWEGRTRRDRDGHHTESCCTPQSRPAAARRGTSKPGATQGPGAEAAAKASEEETEAEAKGPWHGLTWRLIGPYRGGRVLAVSGVRGDTHTYYFGAVGGGVWKTTDSG